MSRKSSPRSSALSLCAVALLVTGAALYAGPLDPPAGSVTSTYKTLTEVEPRIAINLTNTAGDADSLFKITQRGSYYLTGNITGVVGKHGIEIAAANVTVDLMGFDVRGVAGALRGIVSSGSGVTDITVCNGSVDGWPSGGVNFIGNGVFTCKDLRVSSTTGIGISMDTGQIEGCSAFANTSTGLKIAQGGTITRCFASNNGGFGIDAGIIASVTNCAASSNSGDGIRAGGNSVITQCSSQQNGGAGFSVDFSSLVIDSASRLNSGVGIDARGGSTVRGCTVDRNMRDGILAANRSLIIDNSVTLNGQDTLIVGAGIRVSGSDNRIEGNNSAQNEHGIRIDAAGNIIRANTCSGNTVVNYEIVANNIYGVIVDRRSPASAPVSGHAATGTLGTTDPTANFSY